MMLAGFKRRTIYLMTAFALNGSLCGLAMAQPQPSEPPEPPAPRAAQTAEVAAAAKAAKVEAVLAQRSFLPHRATREEAMAAYEKALKEAEKEQETALQAVRAAREQLQAETLELQRQMESKDERSEAELRNLELAQERELRSVQRELERAHENLRRASREVAGVHRHLLTPPRPPRVASPPAPPSPDRGVVGIIMGDSDEEGVRVLGVTPDGPAERAGIRSGDVIIGIMDTPLSDGGSGNETLIVRDVMQEIRPDDEIKIEIIRGDEQLEIELIAEERTEPFTWHSTSRITTISHDGAAPMVIERVELPEVDRETLTEEVRRLSEDLEERRYVIRNRSGQSNEDTFVFEFESLSDTGDAVLAGTNLWFGMPLTRGLKMTELEQGLAGYFGTEQGVLILKADTDNEMGLMSGDVIMKVDDTEVQRPADVMRALRNSRSGSDVMLLIKREQKDEQIVVTIPETRLGFHYDFPGLLGDVDMESWIFDNHAPLPEALFD